MVYWRTNYEGETYLMVDLKGKIKYLKGKEQKNNFIATMIFTNCSTTISGYPSSKKRHNYDGRVAPPKLVVHPKVCKLYYKNYFATYTRNHFCNCTSNFH